MGGDIRAHVASNQRRNWIFFCVDYELIIVIHRRSVETPSRFASVSVAENDKLKFRVSTELEARFGRRLAAPSVGGRVFGLYFLPD